MTYGRAGLQFSTKKRICFKNFIQKILKMSCFVSATNYIVKYDWKEAYK